MSKRTIGIMGGTFNPIHYAHLFIANEALNEFNLDEILFIPTGNPPHKNNIEIDTQHRFEMTRLAILSNSRFSISDIEVNKSVRSYTVDTLKELKKIYNDTDFYFITGTDSILQLETWKNPAELLKLAKFISVVRPGYTNDDVIYKINELQKKYHGEISLLNSVQLQISSTKIRERVRQNKSIKYLLPEAVERYIIENNLYL